MTIVRQTGTGKIMFDIFKRIFSLFLLLMVVSPLFALEEVLPENAGDGLRSNFAFMQARKYEVTGNLKEAYSLYRESYMLDSLNYRSAYRAGRILTDLGHYENAKAAYLRSIAIADDFYPAYNSLGILLKRLGQTVDAIQTLSDGVLAAPEYAPAWRNLGRTLVEAGYEEEALKVYRRAIKLDQGNIESRVTFGILLAKTGEMEKAKHELYTVLRMSPDNKRAAEALEWLKTWPGKQIEKTPAPEVLKGYSEIDIPSLEKERKKSTPKRYDDSWAFEVPTPRMVDVDILKQNARDYIRLGNYKEAEEILRIAVQYEHFDKKVWADYGFALFKLKKYVKSAEAYNKAIKVAKRDKQEVPWYYINRGLSLYYAGDYKEASKALKRAIEYDGELSRAHYFLGLIRIEREQYRYAIKSLKKAIEFAPGHVESHLAIGVAYIKAGAGDRAIIHYRKAQSLRPRDPEILMDLARLLEKERYLKEAGDVYGEFLSVTANMESYRLWRDIAEKRLERYNRGVDLTQATTP